MNPRWIRRNLVVQRNLRTNCIGVEPSARKRVTNAIRSTRMPPSRTGPVWAVAMVRDEADMIAETVSHLLEQRVDHVLVADNGSTDGTSDILHDLSRGGQVHVVRDDVRAFWQAEKVSLLARAATRHGAAWIVPFDADELWFAAEPSVYLADALRNSDTDVVTATWWQYVPLGDEGSTIAERFPYRLPDPDPLPKVTFRPNWLARVSSGGHAVTLPAASTSPGVRIAHFRYRTVEQATRKARDAHAARVAGGLKSQEYWVAVAAEGSAEASRRMQALATTPDLVYDPVANWKGRRDGDR